MDQQTSKSLESIPEWMKSMILRYHESCPISIEKLWSLLVELYLSNILSKNDQNILKTEISRLYSSQIKLHPLVKHSITTGTKADRYFTAAWASSQGRRPTMEDVIVISFQRGLYGCFVLDGHNGIQCAQIIKKKLLETINIIYFLPDYQAKKFFLHEINDKEQESGCCLSGFIFGPEGLKVYNVGDSKTFVLLNDDIIFETSNHTPFTEKERILLSGGTIKNGRVDGKLAIGRAFGNSEIFSILPEPDITTIKNWTSIIVVCDGVTDVLREELITRTTKPNLKHNAFDLCSRALLGFTMDNVSVLMFSPSSIPSFLIDMESSETFNPTVGNSWWNRLFSHV